MSPRSRCRLVLPSSLPSAVPSSSISGRRRRTAVSSARRRRGRARFGARGQIHSFPSPPPLTPYEAVTCGLHSYTSASCACVRVAARRQNASSRSEAEMLITPAPSAARKDRCAPTATSSLPASQCTPSSHQLTFHGVQLQTIGPKVINLKCRVEFHSTQKVNTEMKLIQIASRFWPSMSLGNHASHNFDTDVITYLSDLCVN